ncbi:chemotaxis protein CheW [Roseateles terrae]|uniref:Purine-binding chemotaxis protein CheW n=1 Tax=Roseateles terrae TaxID=431060 RepID=A0ABR6GYI9_9BURK|nr:chemotaxis protein CheW [Roseateles terrae]MBB3197175.1 purine-binding chemotaxis protein CheW [Roseateles terrae]
MDATGEDRPVLVCRVGSRLCAWPLDSVDEILRPRPLRTLMAPVPHVTGLARVRGRWVPVVDVAGAAGLEEVLVGRWVVLHHEDQIAALAVTEVTGVQRLAAQAMDTLPPLLSDAHHAVLSGVATLNDALIALLDPARLMPPPALVAASLGEDDLETAAPDDLDMPGTAGGAAPSQTPGASLDGDRSQSRESAA